MGGGSGVVARGAGGGANAPPAGLKNGGATEHKGRLKLKHCNNLFCRYVNHSLGSLKKVESANTCWNQGLQAPGRRAI